MPYIDLNRRFVERKTYDADELIASEIRGKRLDWPAVLERRICLVVAPANYGKTTEMKHRAAQMRSEPSTAVFIALRALADRGSVEKALTGEDLAAFKTWRESPTETLTLFVDSLDEAAAGKAESIEYLISELAEAVSWPSDRVNWVVSTRPAVLTPAIYGKLAEILARPASTIHTSSVPVSGGMLSHEASSSTTETSTEAGSLSLFSMLPLETKQAQQYLTGHHPSIDGAQLLSIARERGLGGFTKNPGGLDILAHIDMFEAPPNSLTEVFNRVIDAIQILRSADHRLTDAGAPASEPLAQAAQRLAAASQVCQLVNIEMPPATLDIPVKSLSARLIATPILNEASIKQLLNSQLCIDVGFHQVKIYPDELLPFLAARRLADLVESAEQAQRLVQNFIWSAPSGEQGIQREYLPLMGWLATLNPHCRQIILQSDPQALAFFGDLRNAAIPIADAEDALRESFKRLADQGDHPGRGMFTLTSENHWQAGPQRLLPTIASLFEEHCENYVARELLMDIAAASKSDILRGKVLRRSEGDYNRLLGDRAGVEYLLDVGIEDDFKGIAAAIVSSVTANDSLASLLLRRLGWSYFTAREVLSIINRHFAKDRSFFNLSYLFDSEEFLGSASYEQLYKVSRSMVLKVARMSDRRQRLFGTDRRNTDKYVEMAVGIVIAFLSRDSAGDTQKAARVCFVLQHALREGHFGIDKKQLSISLKDNAPVRRALLTYIVGQSKVDDARLMREVFGHRSIFEFQATDVEWLDNPRLSKAFSDYQAQLATPAPQPPFKSKKSSKDNELKIDSKSKKVLKSRRACIADATSTGDLAWIAGWLLQTNTDSRYGEVDFEVFRRAAGKPLADAVLSGLSKLWRMELPRYDEEDPRTTYNITVAGLQGLHLELGTGENLPALSAAEVRQALRYGTFEMNGYPKWFWPLVAAHHVTSISELSNIANEASKGAVSKEHAEELFTALSDAPEPVREVLAPIAWNYLVEQNPSREWVAEQILRAMLENPTTARPKQFEHIALGAMKGAFKSPLPAEPDTALTAQRAAAAMWASYWLTTYPNGFYNAVSNWGPKDPEAVRAFLFALAAHFGRDREGSISQLARSSDDGVEVLGDLYLWTKWAVNPDEDKARPNGVVYSPGARDNAQSFRDTLIPSIASANSQMAYEILGVLRRKATHESMRMYIRRLQFELRERQLTRKPLPQIRYDQFEKDFRAEVTDSLSFAMSVHSDLQAMKYDIERGEHSLRSFFSEIDFTRVLKPGAQGAKAGIALEANFQRLLASELNHHSRGRYSVSVESETAESKRRDVLCSRNDWRASIELKMSERWTIEDYIEALESQLVGQYMRHRSATTGFLVLVLQTKGRRWTNPSTGKKVGFEEVLEILSAKAQELEGKDRSRYLRVIGIDATAPEDFRNRGKQTKAPSVRNGVRPSTATSKPAGKAKPLSTKASLRKKA
ncbi:hypothetical protein [Duganella lactea]|uniref:hypothetical protein n=1 Tax=Duganella lactea TaxID=2692173 RepID=UPI001925B587|nr:hypothetical protein [Duganella lactea]